MGRPKGSKNKPKAPPPDVAAAAAWAKAQGYVAPVAPVPAPVGIPTDFREFVKLLKVRSKDNGRLVPFVLNQEQERIVDAWQAGAGAVMATAEGEIVDGPPPPPGNVLVLKARKLGITTLVVALFLHEWLISPHPVVCMHLANMQDTAAEIMRMAKAFLGSLPEALRPKTPVNNTTTLERENGATIVVRTASTRTGGVRGFTPHLMHISEINFCEDPAEVKASAFGAVPAEGRIIMESTANRIGDPIHEEVKKIRDGKTDMPWAFFFFPWHEHAGYRLKTRGLIRTTEEDKLVEKFGLDDAQLAWRRMTVGKLTSEGIFKRENPATIEEAYANQEGLWFTDEQLAELEELDWSGEGVHRFEPYDAREVYAAGGDCALGTGGDATTLVLINVRTRKPAAIFRSSTTPTPVAIDAMWSLLVEYGNAKVLIERNYFGIPYINGLRALRANMYTEVRHETDGQAPAGEPRDFVTTGVTRSEILEALRAEVLGGAIKVLDRVGLAELRSAKTDKEGKVVFPRTKEGHGDVAFGYALALRCARHVSIPVVMSAFEAARKQQARQALTKRANHGAKYG